MQAVLAGGEAGDTGSQLVVEVEAMQVDDAEVSTPREMQVETMDMLVEDPGELGHMRTIYVTTVSSDAPQLTRRCRRWIC
jgi:hypothetical protein